MWKSKSPTKRTANLCNQFLIGYLSKKKAQLEKLGILKKSYVYHAALLSIKRYPLPIISAQQLRQLYCVGDLLSQELIIVVKNHYKEFQKEPKFHGQTIEEELEQMLPNQYHDPNNSIINKIKVRAASTHGQSQNQGDQDNKSNRSFRSENIERDYRPRPNTQAANILIQLGRIDKGIPVYQNELMKNLRSTNNLSTNKKYNITLANLLKYNYIRKDGPQSQFIMLTEKGISELARLQAKTKIKASQLKIQSLLATFREAHHEQPIGSSKKQRFPKQTIKIEFAQQLVLIIDSREVKDKQEQYFFESRLSEKHGITCMNANLPIGDFAWLYNGQILDYIVQRKKADDLLSSIVDGRYKEQKFRLKNSGFSHIFYLFEGHLKGANALSERSVQTALLKTRIKDEFNVVSVKTITESVKFISFLTESIKKKLETEGELATLGTFEELMQRNSKGSNITVRKIFGLSLKTITGVGKSSVGEVLKYFCSFRSIYKSLKQLGSFEERQEFLRELFKGSGVPKQLPGLLVDILFDRTKN